MRTSFLPAALVMFLIGSARGDDPRTGAARDGDSAPTVSATGTLEPEEVVDVGAQVGGVITKLGADPKDKTKTVDWGTFVEKGTLLAQIDPALYQTRVDQAEAQLQKSKALLQVAEVRVVQAEQALRRAQELEANKAATRTEVEEGHLSVKAYKSEVDAARADVKLAEANLSEARINLRYCAITSPTSGWVIDRRVNIGQTVAPTVNGGLFLLAKDLKRLQVWTTVNEADIGKVQAGQKATFTIGAFPGKTFNGLVSQVRLNAALNQNVVTYTVVLTTDNSDGKLYPYLTAKVRIFVSEGKKAP
jgi:HlyD family secretion protein